MLEVATGKEKVMISNTSSESVLYAPCSGQPKIPYVGGGCFAPRNIDRKLG